MPQLRQLVQKNTEKINRNELMINQMRKENMEQARKAAERYEWLENSRKEHDRWIRHIRETLDEISQITKQSQIEQEKREQKRVQEREQERQEREREREQERQERAQERQERAQERKQERQERAQERKQERQEREQERQQREQERQQRAQERQEREREQEKRKRELDAQFAETDRLIKETAKQMQETNQRFLELKEETNQQLKETALEVKRLSRQLSGTTGHIVEGLVSSSTKRIFQKAGLELHNSGRNLKRSIPSEKIAMEVDVLLSNEEMAVPVEVKANCTEADVKRFLHQMGLFRQLFPEYDGKEVYAAMAAINYEKGVPELAHKEGLLVIRINSDDIFSIDPFKRDELRKF